MKTTGMMQKTKKPGRKPSFNTKTALLNAAMIQKSTVAGVNRAVKKAGIRRNVWLDGALQFALENGYGQ